MGWMVDLKKIMKEKENKGKKKNCLWLYLIDIYKEYL